MGDGIWHTVIPITNEHVFLHLLRSIYFYQHNIERFTGCLPDFNAKLFAEKLIEWERVPSPYVLVYKKKTAWWKSYQWYVEIIKLGKFYCNHVYTYADKLDCEKSSHFYEKGENTWLGKKIPNAAARFRERLPLILHNYGFYNRADYLIKWSIFKGQLGYEKAPLPLGQRLGIFDDISEGIPTRGEADKTVCMPVEELI